jgi:uncharacterized protein YyaL (SSP411 family)
VDAVAGGATRVYRDGAVIRRLLDDYAFVAAAFCDLSEASGDAAVVAQRDFVGALATDHIYMTPPRHGSPLIHRPESARDFAAPSGAAIAVETMLHHGARGGDADVAALARRLARLAGRPPFACGVLHCRARKPRRQPTAVSGVVDGVICKPNAAISFRVGISVGGKYCDGGVFVA